MKDYRRYLKSIVTVGAGNILAYALNLIFFILAAHFLIFEDFGLFRYLVSLAMILYTAFFAGAFTALSRFMSAGKNGHLLASAFLFSLLLLIAILPLMFVLGSLSLVLLTLSFFASQFIYSYLRGLQAYASLALYLLSVNAIRIALLALLFAFPAKIVLFSLIYFASALLPVPFLKIKIALRGLESAKLKEVLRFSLPLYLSSTAYILLANLDAVFIKLWLSEADLSYYMAAKTLCTVFVFAPFAVSTVILPETSKNMRIKRNLIFGLTIAFAISLLLALPFLAIPGLLIALVYPSSYMPAASLLPLMSLAMVFFALSDVFASVWTGAGKPLYEGLVLGIGAILDGSLLYLLLPGFGIMAGALSLLFSYALSLILWLLLSFWALRKNKFK